MQYLRIVNWETFQHYKHRNPPWIKLERQLLSSRTWVCSDDATRILTIALMLLAAGTENRIPADADYIRRVAFLNQDPDFSRLVANKFVEIVDESGNPSEVSQQDAKTETAEQKETSIAVGAVWDYYIDTIHKNPKLYTFTDKRIRMGKARLRDLLPRVVEPKLENAVALMKLCVDRLAASPFHSGQNDQKKQYLDWENCFRSTDQMEKWLDDSRFGGGSQ